MGKSSILPEAMTRWQLEGTYAETCNCDFLCPCITGSGPPTKGYCHFAMGYHVRRGHYGDVDLGGRSFVILGYTPSSMGSGNWSIGLIIDDGASSEQTDALRRIATGAEGGPIANLAPLISKFLGVEQQPIDIRTDGMNNSVKAGAVVDQANRGVPGAEPGEPIYLDNVGHPTGTRLALARATRSHVHAFGLDWDDESGRNNGHFAPFNWSGGA